MLLLSRLSLTVISDVLQVSGMENFPNFDSESLIYLHQMCRYVHYILLYASGLHIFIIFIIKWLTMVFVSKDLGCQDLEIYVIYSV